MRATGGLRQCCGWADSRNALYSVGVLKGLALDRFIECASASGREHSALLGCREHGTGRSLVAPGAAFSKVVLRGKKVDPGSSLRFVRDDGEVFCSWGFAFQLVVRRSGRISSCRIGGRLPAPPTVAPAKAGAQRLWLSSARD